ncbi:MAG: zf-HC2 domain-containing protein [Candidatus Acidiferrales bacterium]
MSRIEPHDEFLELCAVSTSGQLTEEDQRRLQEHLAVCSSCREALQQYEAIIRHAIPAMAADETPENLEAGPRWSVKRAESALFDRIAREEGKPGIEQNGPIQVHRQTSARRILAPASAAAWRSVWALYAAGILLFIALGFFAYQVGIRRGTNAANVAGPYPDTQSQISLEEKLSDASHEREVARAQVEQRDNLIADLRRQLEQESAKMDQMKAAQEQSDAALRNADAGRQELIQQRTEAEQKFNAAQLSEQALQTKLDSIADKPSQDAKQAAALDARVNELTNLLHQRDAVVDQQQELLAHDRDIRELIGARDLYVAEVYDVARNGATQKPYGRVFYTKGKSLIFYAYDLDQQTVAKNANTFQVWGRRGPDREQAFPLGIFYEDNAAKKRWVLKLDDPKLLAQIDAVFVTVEPNDKSRKPSGKPLLFAYLRVDPNHP